MKRFLAAVAVVALTACAKEETRPMTEYESADAEAAAFNFQVYPKAEYLPKMTDLLRRAHFVLFPEHKEAPPTAAYHTDDSVEAVAQFYATKYGHGEVAPNAVNNFSATPPKAYYRTGDVRADAEAAAPVLQKLNLKSDLTKATGTYKGAHISLTGQYPRVTIQRPYFDHQQSAMIDKTLIIMVKE